MATTGTKTKNEYNLDLMSDDEKRYYRDYKEDLQAHDDAIVNFDAYEAMHNGLTYDAVSKETSNGLTDSATATIYLERAARVAGQLPSGEVIAFGKKDKGKGMFMDLLRQKWIYPNANAQKSFKVKMFMWQYGSSEYGFMPMYYDINVRPDGKVVPDCWLWNPRMFIPQAGLTSVPDMDYCHALAKKTPKFFQDILDDEGDDTWDKEAIKDVIDQIKEKTNEADPSRDTLEVKRRQKQGTRQIIIATRYEAGRKGRWISFLPEFNCKVIRDIENPHKNSRIPFVIKPCIPTFDSFYGIGDFQRSMPMQFANDGLDNFYFQGIKINLFPAFAINSQTAIHHTIDPNTPGSVMEFNGTPEIKRIETSTAGLSTYQAAKGMAKGAIQSIAGTTDTRLNAENSMDPGFGKTPAAINKISEREDTRDSQDREMLEESMKELIDGMISLIPIIKTKIPIDLFASEIEEIVKAGHTDILDLFKAGKSSGLLKFRVSESGEQMRLTLDPSKFEGLEYRFELEPNSTAKKTKEQQLTALIDFWNFIGKMPNALQDFKATTGKVPNWEKIFNQFGTLADLDMDGMFIQPEVPEEETAETTTETPLSAAPPVDPNAAAVMPAQGAPVAAAPVVPVVQEDPMVVNGMRFNDPAIAAQARAVVAAARGGA